MLIYINFLFAMAQEMLNAPYLKRQISRVNREEDSPVRKRLCFSASEEENVSSTPKKNILIGSLKDSPSPVKKTPSSIKTEPEIETIDLVTPPLVNVEWQEYNFNDWEDNSVPEQSLHFDLSPLNSEAVEKNPSLEKSVAINALATGDGKVSLDVSINFISLIFPPTF